MAKCFSCPGDCKELSKKTKRSTYDSNQAMADPTADLRQQLADHEASRSSKSNSQHGNVDTQVNQDL